MYSLVLTTKFKKDFKRFKRRGYPASELKNILQMLHESGTVPGDYKPHKLLGKYHECWECHIKSDLLIIWKVYEDQNKIALIRTGTHSDLGI